MTSEAFEKIYDTFKNQVYNLALHYVRSKEDAREITQDVFVTVHASMDAFRKDSQLSTWIYRITINKSLDALKARKRKKRFAVVLSLFRNESGELRFDPPAQDHPELEMSQNESVSYIFRGIDALPDPQKTALILSKIENKSQVEIAQIMDTTPKAVESLVQRARKNLLIWLEKNEGK